MPRRIEREGQRLPATYLNFLFVNGALLVPVFGDRNTERPVLKVLQELLPHHRVMGIDCSELIWGLGAVHCLSQQQPAV
jgi:agmatine deiminase